MTDRDQSDRIATLEAEIAMLRAELRKMPKAKYVAAVTDCEACLTPDACAIRGQCAHYLRTTDNASDRIAALEAAAREARDALEHDKDLLCRYEINRVNGEQIADTALAKIRSALAALDRALGESK